MKQFDVYLRDRIIELDVAIQELSLRNDIAVQNDLKLFVNRVTARIVEYLDVHTGILLSEPDAKPQKTAFAKGSNELVLSAHIAASDEKIVNELKSAMALDSSTGALINNWFYACERLYGQLTASDIAPLRTAYCSIYPVGWYRTIGEMDEGEDGERFSLEQFDKMALHEIDVVGGTLNLTKTLGPVAAKKMTGQISSFLELEHRASAVSRCSASAECEPTLLMNSNVSTSIGRHRLLGDMDGTSTAELTLEQLDPMSLLETDIVVFD